MEKGRQRLHYLDGIKFLDCMIIFWTHVVGIFWMTL